MDEKQIAKFMKNLGISREEAIQLIADDANDVSVELTDEQKKVAKQMAQGDRKKETEKRKRERKPDDDKRFLISYLVEKLTEILYEAPVVTNLERELEFSFGGTKYRLTLAKPRKEK